LLVNAQKEVKIEVTKDKKDNLRLANDMSSFRVELGLIDDGPIKSVVV